MKKTLMEREGIFPTIFNLTPNSFLQMKLICSFVVLTLTLSLRVSVSLGQETSSSYYIFLQDYLESLALTNTVEPCIVNTQHNKSPNYDPIGSFQQCYGDGIQHLNSAKEKLLKYEHSTDQAIKDTVQATLAHYDALIETLTQSRKIYDDIYMAILAGEASSVDLGQTKQLAHDLETDRQRLDLLLVADCSRLRGVSKIKEFNFTKEEQTALQAQVNKLFGVDVSKPDAASKDGSSACANLIYFHILNSK